MSISSQWISFGIFLLFAYLAYKWLGGKDNAEKTKEVQDAKAEEGKEAGSGKGG